jgi:hypothetical protein
VKLWKVAFSIALLMAMCALSTACPAGCEGVTTAKYAYQHQTVTFAVTTVESGVTYTWTMFKDGDGVVDSGAGSSWTTTAPDTTGIYWVLLSASKTGDPSCLTVKCLKLVVKDLPCPTFSTSYCFGLTPTLGSGYSLPSGVSGLYWVWSYRTHGTPGWTADGNGANPSLPWSTLAVGTYDLKFEIYKTGDGLIKSCPILDSAVTVTPRPLADFGCAACTNN